MDLNSKRSKPVTLLKSFNKRLIILFCAFSLVTSVLVVISYQSYTESLNSKEINETMKHMVPRLKDLDRRRDDSPLLIFHHY